MKLSCNRIDRLWVFAQKICNFSGGHAMGQHFQRMLLYFEFDTLLDTLPDSLLKTFSEGTSHQGIIVSYRFLAGLVFQSFTVIGAER